MTTEPTESAHNAENIREEQGTHAAGTVPAAYLGGAGEAGRRPEDALQEPDTADAEDAAVADADD
ncbi:hypothetical protein H9639_14645 [Arthrobacter sp. Sa2CUA1]|uniref:Uncharacterized protein n=1 Tax=Arthrobacter gallicola TaxID=2762225 RepID=A0ABR8UVD9_9MICC|nr:hypothetical protein [Arthrobacter gallicola]MBD7996536.1 hypothetical protein [Arthrobacter gallicola]